MSGTTKTRFNVQVTEADIERAHKNDSYKCVVAQAIARTVVDATNIEVDTQTIRFTTEGERRMYLTPYAVQGYVIAFDAGDPIQPFSFHLRDPKRSRRKKRTEAGKAADRAAVKARRAAREKKSSVGTSTGVPTDEREAAKAAYAQARADHPEKATETPGQKPTPRVFKQKRRAYGHRLLRINQEDID